MSSELRTIHYSHLKAGTVIQKYPYPPPPPFTDLVSGFDSKPCENLKFYFYFTYLNHTFAAITTKKDVLSVAAL